MRNVQSIKVRIGGGDGLVKQFKGRFAWTLVRLFEAGVKGVTPIENPAPRWSQYVHVLRREGIAIDTVGERHGGPYAGRHGRYVLLSPIEIIEIGEDA